MKQSTFSDKAMTIFSLSLLVLVVVLFAWMWFGGQAVSSGAYKTTEDLKPVSVAGLETRAKTLLDGLKNNSGIPVSEPTTKEGRADPFASL